jgi:hypothetical protein
MSITVGHDPNVNTMLQMGYLAGLGGYNRWLAEYQQRADMQRASLNSSHSAIPGSGFGGGYNAPWARYPYQSALMDQRYDDQLRNRMALAAAGYGGGGARARGGMEMAPSDDFATDTQPAPPAALAPAPLDFGGHMSL